MPFAAKSAWRNYENFGCTEDGKQLLPSGAIIHAENVKGETKFKVDGNVPAASLAKVLGELIYTARPDEPTADEEMGTDKSKKVGDSWPVNGEQLAKATRLLFTVTAVDFKGHVTLSGVSTIDGKPTEAVKLTNTCQLDSRQGTNGKTYKDLKMSFEGMLTLPVDPTAQVLSSTFDRTITYTHIGQDGIEQVRAERKRELFQTESAK